jgi:hypothetical protein
MTSQPRELPFWHDLPELDQPVPDVAADQRARTDQALARLRASEQRIDRQMCDQWLMSHSAADIYPHTEE